MTSNLLILLTLCFFISLTTAFSSSFVFNNFTQDSNFNSLLSLYADAKPATNGLSLQLTTPLVSSVGRVFYKNPIKFYSGNPKKLVSFSTYFSFLFHPGPGLGSGSDPGRVLDSGLGPGNGLAFVVFADGYPLDLFDYDGKFKFLSVEFNTLLDNNINNNESDNNVYLKVTNMTAVNLRVKSGDRLQVWIDYESNSRRLEVRLSKFGENRPVDPVLFERVELAKIWPGSEGFVVGLSSYNRNSSDVCNVYSWRFKVRRAPDWMHSEPLDPVLMKEGVENVVKVHKKSDCVMRVLSALILGIGLGALGAFVGMFVWTVFGKRQPISPEEYAATKAVGVVHGKGYANEKQ